MSEPENSLLPRRPLRVLALAALLALSGLPLPALEPNVLTYREVDGRSLKAYVFPPAKRDGRERTSAILLFHGGGWDTGAAEWTFDRAQWFASLGMVAIPIEYRLSQGKVTPIEALTDVCAAFRWTRRHADELGLDPRRVAGYGVSAGGHLVASTATVGCPPETGDSTRAEPDALLLWSPAIDVASDRWFHQKLQGRGTAAEYSPAEHVRPTTPPTSIVQGAEDVLTPLAGARRYCEKLKVAGGVCELNVYERVGHLLTRNLAHQESDFDPDPEARADGLVRLERFLKQQGFLSGN